MARKKKSTLKLPQRLETWCLAVRELRIWIAPDNEKPYRPFCAIFYNIDKDLIQGFPIFPAAPTPEQVLEALFEVMLSRPPGSLQRPHRPKRIHFEDENLADALSSPLEEIGVTAVFQPAEEVIDELIEELEDRMGGGPDYPGLLTQKDVVPELLGDVFEAAAHFFRVAPWVHLTNVQSLAIKVGRERKYRYVIVMGNGGVEYGLSLYKTWDDLVLQFSPADYPLERISSRGANVFFYEDITMVPFDDLEAIDRYGWEVASEEGYPVPVIYTRDGDTKRPDRKDLLWYEAAMRAICEFVPAHLKPNKEGDYDPVKVTFKVSTHEGPKKVEIKYPAGELPFATQPVDFYDWEDYEGEDIELPPGFDLRSMEGAMSMFGGGFDDPDVAKAQKIMYEAWEEQDPVKRITLAHKALSISPNCADAYVLLAEEEADTLDRAAGYYQKAVEVGERTLGKKFFDENEGHFWGILETRPYMRARAGLASILWRLGRREEASTHYRDMLRLNPGDNQGNRYALLDLLLELGHLEEVDTLLSEYEDDWSAEWCYTKALRAFQAGGNTKAAKTALAEALEQNPHVPKFLLGEKRIPNRLPDFISLGRESEAISYASSHLNFWRKTDGATQWLKKQMQTRKK
jgi:hypothetical protein